MINWQPMATAPKGAPILAMCRHDADPYWIEETKSLTTYGAHCEGVRHVADGPHVVEWGGEVDDTNFYNPNAARIPDWWFRTDSDFEVVANPIGWMPIPAHPGMQ